MYDFYVFSTLKDYMSRYKPYLTDPERHIPIDAFYINDNKIIFTLLDNPNNIIRPKLDSSVAVINHSDISKHVDPLQYDKVTYHDVFVIPKSFKIGFIRYGLIRKKYKFTIRCARIIGDKPMSDTQICFNWFFDSYLKQINFVMS